MEPRLLMVDTLPSSAMPSARSDSFPVPAPPRACAAVASLLLVAAGLLLAEPTIVTVGLVTALTALRPARVHWTLAVPAASLVLVGSSTVLSVLAGAWGPRSFDSPATAAVLLAVPVAALVRQLRLPVPPDPATTQGPPLWVLAPALVALGISAVQLTSARVAARWLLLATDPAEHMVLLDQLRAAGSLSYQQNSYPRGLHALLAATEGPLAPPPGTSAALTHTAQVWASATWLSTALLLWAVAVVTWRIALHVQVRPAAPALAAGAYVLCLDDFQVALVHMGAGPALLAVVALWAVPMVSGLPASPRVFRLRVLLTGALATAVAAHTWQPLVVVPLCAAVLALAPEHRRTPVLRSPRATTVGAVAVAVLLLGSALPPMLSVQSAGGAGLAAIPGTIPGPPWGLLLAGLAALAAVLPRLGLMLRLAWSGTALGLGVALAVLVWGAGEGLDLTQYYPRKTLWFITLVSAPVLAPAAALALRKLRRVVLDKTEAMDLRAVMRGGVAAAVVLLVLAPLAPGTVGRDSLLRTSLFASGPAEPGVRRLTIAATVLQEHPGRVVVPSEAALTTLRGTPGAYVVSKLLRLQTGQPTNHGLVHQVCDDLARVAAAAPAVVITDLPGSTMSELMQRHGCGGAADVVRLSGSIDPVTRQLAEELLSASSPE